ncbi:MAG: class I SAM-dependent methyltransferase [Candidatus Brockarchaeota archaeon]|nr:class I SAM-dependent methyltransferase [Candidatus Brockarchaeota archaeon]
MNGRVEAMGGSDVVRAVRDAFDAIAEDFDKKRTQPFPSVERICGRLTLGGCVLDAGTGNGRHVPFILGGGGRAVAADVSLKMLETCKRNLEGKGLRQMVELVLCEISELPFKEGAFTGALYSAVLHHLPSPMRKKALEELKRTVKPGGAAIITLWSARALKARSGAREAGKAALKGDYLIPWKFPGGARERYYHLFTAEEARGELEESSITNFSVFEEGLNIVIVLER